MKTLAKWSAGSLLVILIAYYAGPKPSKPTFGLPALSIPASLTELEEQITSDEKEIQGLKPDNEARIVWADSLKKEKTKIAFLYLHGFSASQAEGEPVHRNIARKYHANLYLARLAEHGIDKGDSTMINLTAGVYEASAEKALEVAGKLGEEVIVIGTSAGGALTLFLASRHPWIKAIVLFSPAVKLYDKSATLLDNHWGLQIVRLVQGSPMMQFRAESKAHDKYWELQYRIEALVALQNLLTHTMKPEFFASIKCPVFLAYYYKNEMEQDRTVSVPAMLKMYNELGTPDALKQKQAFPEAGSHVIASHIRSKDWQNVEQATIKFLTDIVNL